MWAKMGRWTVNMVIPTKTALVSGIFSWCPGYQHFPDQFVGVQGSNVRRQWKNQGWLVEGRYPFATKPVASNWLCPNWPIATDRNTEMTPMWHQRWSKPSWKPSWKWLGPPWKPFWNPLWRSKKSLLCPTADARLVAGGFPCWLRGNFSRCDGLQGSSKETGRHRWKWPMLEGPVGWSLLRKLLISSSHSWLVNLPIVGCFVLS